MGKWTDMDSDEQRLPEGVERIGYDADTQTYTFRDASGRTYESAPGNRYGVLRPSGQASSGRRTSSASSLEAQDSAAHDAAALKKDSRDSVRMMLPFALLVFVFLLLVLKFVNGSGSDTEGRQVVDCAQGSHQVQIRKGDTCWAIGQEYRVGVEELLKIGGNEKVDCGRLRLGQGICVPDDVD